MSRSFWSFVENSTKVSPINFFISCAVVVYTARSDPVSYIYHRVPVKVHNCSGFKARELGKKKVLIVSYQNFFIFVGGVYASWIILASIHLFNSASRPIKKL